MDQYHAVQSIIEAHSNAPGDDPVTGTESPARGGLFINTFSEILRSYLPNENEVIPPSQQVLQSVSCRGADSVILASSVQANELQSCGNTFVALLKAHVASTFAALLPSGEAPFAESDATLWTSTLGAGIPVPVGKFQVLVSNATPDLLQSLTTLDALSRDSAALQTNLVTIAKSLHLGSQAKVFPPWPDESVSKQRDKYYLTF